MTLPRGDRIALVEAAQLSDRVPQQVDLPRRRGLGKDLRRPSRASGRHDRPIDLVARNLFAEIPDRAGGCLLDLGDQARVLVFQVIRIVRVDREHRVVVLDVFEEGAREPFRELSERLARGVLEPQEQQLLVAPQHFDQRRASAVGAHRDPTDERRRLERRAAVGERTDDEQPLAGSQVQADLDDQVAVRVK